MKKKKTTVVQLQGTYQWRYGWRGSYRQNLGTLSKDKEDPLNHFRQRNNMIQFVFQKAHSAAAWKMD